jgi:hypothetical protein
LPVPVLTGFVQILCSYLPPLISVHSLFHQGVSQPFVSPIIFLKTG